MEIIPYNPHTSPAQQEQQSYQSSPAQQGQKSKGGLGDATLVATCAERSMPPIERLHKIFKFDDIPEKERAAFIARIVKLMKKNTHLQYLTKRDFLIILAYNEIIVAIEEMNKLIWRIKEYRKNNIQYDPKKEKEDRVVIKNVFNEVFAKSYSLLSLEEPHYDMKLNNLLRELICIMKKYNKMERRA